MPYGFLLMIYGHDYDFLFSFPIFLLDSLNFYLNRPLHDWYTKVIQKVLLLLFLLLSSAEY